MKNKSIKINFRYFWGGFNPENNFFTNLLRKDYNVIVSDNPDYMFYSVYPEIHTRDVSKEGKLIKRISPRIYIFLKRIYPKILLFLKRKKRLPEIEGNFVKIFYGPEYVKPNMNKCDWAFSTYLEEDMNNYRYMRIPLTIVNDYQLKNFGIPPVKKHINFKNIKREKMRFCNFIYSQDVSARNSFFEKLSKYKKVDAPGRCMINMLPISRDNARDSRSSTNWVIDKLNFLKKYKFTIAFENANSPGGVTEKLTHPMLVNSIPIYFGDKSINKEFNTKSFINYNNFKNMDEFIKYIIKVDNDDKLYEKILRESWYKYNKLPKDFNINRIQRRFKEIIESRK